MSFLKDDNKQVSESNKKFLKLTLQGPKHFLLLASILTSTLFDNKVHRSVFQQVTHQ